MLTIVNNNQQIPTFRQRTVMNRTSRKIGQLLADKDINANHIMTGGLAVTSGAAAVSLAKPDLIANLFAAPESAKFGLLGSLASILGAMYTLTKTKKSNGQKNIVMSTNTNKIKPIKAPKRVKKILDDSGISYKIDKSDGLFIISHFKVDRCVFNKYRNDWVFKSLFQYIKEIEGDADFWCVHDIGKLRVVGHDVWNWDKIKDFSNLDFVGGNDRLYHYPGRNSYDTEQNNTKWQACTTIFTTETEFDTKQHTTSHIREYEKLCGTKESCAITPAKAQKLKQKFFDETGLLLHVPSNSTSDFGIALDAVCRAVQEGSLPHDIKHVLIGHGSGSSIAKTWKLEGQGFEDGKTVEIFPYINKNIPKGEKVLVISCETNCTQHSNKPAIGAEVELALDNLNAPGKIVKSGMDRIIGHYTLTDGFVPYEICACL